jgi:hypothetical protein
MNTNVSPFELKLRCELYYHKLVKLVVLALAAITTGVLLAGCQGPSAVTAATHGMLAEKMSRAEAVAVLKQELQLRDPIRFVNAWGMRSPDVYVLNSTDEGFSLVRINYDYKFVIEANVGDLRTGKGGTSWKEPNGPKYFNLGTATFEGVSKICFSPATFEILLYDKVHETKPFIICSDLKRPVPARTDRILAAILVLCPNAK